MSFIIAIIEIILVPEKNVTTPFWPMNQISVDANQTSDFESDNHLFIELSSSNHRHRHSLVGIIVLINTTTLQYTSRMSNQKLIENQLPVVLVNITMCLNVNYNILI